MAIQLVNGVTSTLTSCATPVINTLASTWNNGGFIVRPLMIIQALPIAAYGSLTIESSIRSIWNCCLAYKDVITRPPQYDNHIQSAIRHYKVCRGAALATLLSVIPFVGHREMLREIDVFIRQKTQLDAAKERKLVASANYLKDNLSTLDDIDVEKQITIFEKELQNQIFLTNNDIDAHTQALSNSVIYRYYVFTACYKLCQGLYDLRIPVVKIYKFVKPFFTKGLVKKSLYFVAQEAANTHIKLTEKIFNDYNEEYFKFYDELSAAQRKHKEQLAQASKAVESVDVADTNIICAIDKQVVTWILPHDITYDIFMYLNKFEQANAALTCKNWRQLVRSNYLLLQSDMQGITLPEHEHSLRDDVIFKARGMFKSASLQFTDKKSAESTRTINPKEITTFFNQFKSNMQDLPIAYLQPFAINQQPKVFLEAFKQLAQHFPLLVKLDLRGCIVAGKTNRQLFEKAMLIGMLQLKKHKREIQHIDMRQSSFSSEAILAVIKLFPNLKEVLFYPDNATLDKLQKSHPHLAKVLLQRNLIESRPHFPHHEVLSS